VEVKFLAYVLNVTQRFVMHFISYANVVYFICIAVGNGRQLWMLLCRRVHGAALGRKRETFQVSKDSSVVCS
jgi:hypothetical protein